MTAATQVAEGFETNDRGWSWVRRLRGLPAQLPGDYPLAAIAAFVFSLAALVAVRTQLPSEALRDMHWLLAVAVVPILPWLLPLAAQHVSQLRAGPLELSFRDLDPDQIAPSNRAIEDVAVALRDATVAEMPSKSGEIVRRVKETETERTEVVLVNLGGAPLKSVMGRYAHVYPRVHPGTRAPLGWTLSEASTEELRRQLHEANAPAVATARSWLGDVQVDSCPTS
jgi:hypothetical protein